jgi:hypothetical protein
MNWDAVGAVAELIGALGVVITLAYLAVQIRQNTQTVRSTAQQGMFDNVHTLQLALSQDDELARLVVKANEEYDSLRPEEVLRFSSFAGALFGQWSNVFSQRQHSMVDPEIWMTWEAGYRAVLVSPAIRRVWESVKEQFTPAFQRHVDGEG